MGRCAGVNGDAVVVGVGAGVVGRVDDAGGVGVCAHAHGAVLEAPGGAADGGVADDHAVAQHLHALAAGQTCAQAARHFWAGVVGLAVVGDHAHHRGLVVAHFRDGDADVGAGALEVDGVGAAEGAGVATTVFDPCGVGVGAAVGQATGGVGEAPAHAADAGVSDFDAVAVDGDDFVAAQRGGEGAAQFGLAVVGAAAVGHAAHTRRGVVFHRGDGDGLAGGLGVHAEGVAAGDGAVVAGFIGDPGGVGDGAAAGESVVLEAPVQAVDAGLADDAAVAQDVDPLARAKGHREGAAQLGAGVVGAAVVADVAFARRLVVLCAGDGDRGAGRFGVHGDDAAGFGPRHAGGVDHPRFEGVVAVGQGVAAVVKAPRGGAGLHHVLPDRAVVQADLHFLARAQGAVGAADDQGVVAGDEVARHPTVFADAANRHRRAGRAGAGGERHGATGCAFVAGCVGEGVAELVAALRQWVDGG